MPDPRLLPAIAALERALARTNASHMLIGGVAVAVHGVRRLTDDVDATVWAPDVTVPELLRHLASQRIVPRIRDAVRFASRSHVLLLRHDQTMVDIDVSLAWLPFEREALDRAKAYSLQKTRVPVAAADDLIIYKAIAARERDKSDVERLIEIFGSALDFDRIRRTVAALASALEKPELADALEALVQKAGGSRPTRKKKVAPRSKKPHGRKRST